MEINRYLLEADSGQRFDFEEFVDRVAEREGRTDPGDRGEVVYHARVIVDLVNEVVPAGEMEQVRGQLPADFDDLFELVDREGRQA